jgi:uncharacterized phosphosugar-binding protein
MTDIADRYFAGVIDRLQEVRATEGPAIDRAAEACAESIAADKLVFSFGTGHGSLPALEMFPRTGTIVGFRPIVESTMISFHHVWGDMGARQYRFIHAVEGYGKAILRSHQLDPADTMVLFSHSGVNAVILDIALTAKETGMKVIGVTSVQHSSASPSRHSSGQKLYPHRGAPGAGRSELDQHHHRNRPRHCLSHGRETGAARLGAVRDGEPQHSR